MPVRVPAQELCQSSLQEVLGQGALHDPGSSQHANQVTKGAASQGLGQETAGGLLHLRARWLALGAGVACALRVCHGGPAGRCALARHGAAARRT